MRSPVVAFLVLATLGAGPLVPAQVSPEGDGYRIKLKYVAGEKTRYGLKTDVNITGGPEGMPAPPKVEATMEQEVVSVEEGVATLKITTIGGPEGTPGEQTMKVDEKGQVVGQDSSAMGGLPSPLPDRPLKVGEEWSSEVSPPGMPQAGGKAKVDYKFVGMVKVGEGDEAKTVAQIDFKIAMGGEVEMEGAGSVMLNPTNGQLVSSTARNVVKMTLPGVSDQMTISVNVEMKQLPAKAD